MRQEPEVIRTGPGSLWRWFRRMEPLEIMDIMIIMLVGFILLLLF